jgi:[acyl-carrier-protein] S-malonyltransferase
LQAGGMVSLLGLDRDKVEEIVEQARGDQVLRIANLLCPGNIVVSGNNEACTRAKELAEAADAMKVIPLAVAGAFHTSLMEPAIEQLKEALANVAMSAPRIPVIFNVDATAHNDPEEMRQLLVRQVVSPVLWEDSMRNLLEQGFDDFYEVGPGRVLRGLLRRIDRKKSCENISA